MELSQFETVWDRGVLGLLKASALRISKALVYIGVSIGDRIKTPDQKRLDYMFSPEARGRTIDIASGEPVLLLGDIEHK